ncbi:4-hydroxybenzaldehyde dehydrogenase (NADP(+)) [Zhongshania aliphaticivorans]|uniref:4-hydroxybenzaldehyde dehydrogenase (NADP(+)) n=1 Tax=Zhongshania aliphaticivorans TaxID=1470434 RepID=A0A5S9MYZ4_9GAMM|nr:aldehyde dehydrogenase family protein [Zhongshania aliphaticivorans]CAA0081924.1 4-hydroxybenzaldehyde dehydrogenase (NADP(+)) [Zhongshania aliphaticivorans]CAA0084575.1 4-hydroxybenzaldehyde dehydrogenase (NADP(+)) [Zhongshania aliphaticivorans]
MNQYANKRHGLLIGGQELPAVGEDWFEVLSPLDEKPFATVASAGEQDVDLAVETAVKGAEQWAALAPKEREAILLQAAHIMQSEGESRYLDLLIRESGSSITKARFEIQYTVDLLRTAAGEVRRLYGDTFPNDRPDRMSMVFREPLGVVAVVSPYNAPLALLCKMVAFPLAAGNSVVIKPSEETPIIALAFARLLIEAGLPAEAINVLPGFGVQCGSPLVNHRKVDGIALTGSTQTGKLIGAAAMQRMVPAQLELGGKSALLVLRDVDPEKAAAIAVAGMFNHGGQICMANSRIVVEQPVYEAFCTAIKREAEALKIGDVYSAECAYGPLINRRAVEKIQAHQTDALERGASLLCGGRNISGLVYEPTLLLNPPLDASIWREESFGPLASIVVASDLDEAITLANDSDYGLSAAVLTHNIKWGFKAARKIKAGAVHIGMHSFQSNALAPVGGSGYSGVGRSGGKFSTEEFTELKWVSLELGDSL